MTLSKVEVAGEGLSDFLRSSTQTAGLIDVVSAPPSWPDLKPDFVRFARRHRAAGQAPPAFRGVPVCLFGSEWPGFHSAPRTAPARGRCADCDARDACGFEREVPVELEPISRASLAERWAEYGESLCHMTGCDIAGAATPVLERIVDAYRGPVSLEPSVLVDEAVEAALRFVVFPHRAATGAEAVPAYERTLVCMQEVAATVCGNPARELAEVLAALPPAPLPIGLDARRGRWSVKSYIRVEEKTPVQRAQILNALSRLAPGMTPVSPANLQMIGLVVDESGLHTVKAYILARPTGPVEAGFPVPLTAEHPLIAMSGDAALATLDIWRRGERRADKWDFNLRDHYLAGESARRLVARLASPPIADRLRPLLGGATYRADVVAVGVRDRALALYMELN